MEPGSCTPCATLTENCYGRNFTSPRPGYWRSSPTSLNYIECFKKEVCLGGDIDHPLGRCATGYGGIVCTDCIDGYYRSDSFECTKCPSLWINIFTFVFLLVICLIAVVVLVRATISSSRVNNKKPLY